MKFLLTSAGLSNKSLKETFLNLVGKPAKKIKVSFIPTAANIFPGDKSWLIKDLAALIEIGTQVDIVDISALPIEIIKTRLEDTDVLFFEGGSEFYLMEQIIKSGLDKLLPNLLASRLWVGVSAGSMVPGLHLLVSNNDLYEEPIGTNKDMAGLRFIDFNVLPHLDSKFFPGMRVRNIKKMASKDNYPAYVIDDNTGIIVNDNKIQIVSEGKWIELK